MFLRLLFSSMVYYGEITSLIHLSVVGYGRYPISAFGSVSIVDIR